MNKTNHSSETKTDKTTSPGKITKCILTALTQNRWNFFNN